MPQASPKAFFAAFAALALTVERMTGNKLLAETALVQWADETGWHTDGVSQGREGWRGENNLAGISPANPQGKNEIADYVSVEAFADAYVNAIDQSGYGFPEVLAATNPELQMVRLGRSQWSGSHYNRANDGRPGADLVSIYRTYQEDITAAIHDAHDRDVVVTHPEAPETPTDEHKEAAEEHKEAAPIQFMHTGDYKLTFEGTIKDGKIENLHITAAQSLA